MHVGIELFRKNLVYLVAGAISLIGHLALVSYGESASVVSSSLHAEQAFSVLLTSDKSRISEEKEVRSSVSGPFSGTQKSRVAMKEAEPEQLFPAFYRVHYYEPRELTQKPFVTRDIPHDFSLQVPNVPENAAIFLLLISEYGDVDKVIVENSSLPQSAQLELEATFKAVKFYPGEIRGAPVKSLLKIQIRLDSGSMAKEKTMD